MFNAFADIDWLPPPGVVPGQATYWLDRLHERSLRALALCDDVKLIAYLQNARERLAEMMLLIDRSDIANAKTAVAAYDDDVRQVTSLLSRLPPSATTASLRVANALLEHQYIATFDYLDRPKNGRRVIGQLVATANSRYEKIRARLPAAERAGLFFKEEEVRWAWEMARQGDAQGL